MSHLSAKISMGVTELLVGDLKAMTGFYHHLVGLDVIEETPNVVLLGSGSVPIVRLIKEDMLRAASAQSAGLYHNAILFASRAALAQTLENILTNQPFWFSGSADHLVSEAFYFSDPEGNGLELYFDKDADTWQWQDGQVVMGAVYIDPEAYIEQHRDELGADGKKMGHVHLKVGSVDLARSFYVDVLGFAITAEYPGALFVSDGQYHHHLGLNMWESAGAEKRTKSLGLQSVQVVVNSASDLENLQQRLQVAQLPFVQRDGQIVVEDPWGNELLVGVR